MYKVIEDLVADARVSALRVFPERIQQRLYFPIAAPPAPIAAFISEPSLKCTQKVWRFLPVGFRHEFGPKLQRKLKSVFR